ncbi:MAG: serine/threonine protein kinase, partial [Lentisphaerae bacterium]|nr:serine/threonine protein kinase [Lentisphaerota bacterium]
MDDQQSPADHLDGQPTMRAAGARQPAPGGVANTPGAARGAGGPGLGGQGGAGNAPAASGVDGPVTLTGMRTEEVLLPGADGPVLGRVDRYVLRRRLGAGGFGVVYLADDTVAQIPVALKTLPGQIANNPGELERMRENFALVQKLAHPHIASLKYLHRIDVVDAAAKDALRVLSGDYLLVMEYVAGSTLSDWRCLFPGRKVPLAESLRLCSQIASALDYAHAEKIVHRDIKPANIMVLGGLDADAQVKVLDFGLAAEIRSSMSRVSQEKGSSSGTPPYMSPEQWLGQRQGAASDQYSLAVLFYELISGDVPFASAFAIDDWNVKFNAATRLTPQPLEELTKRQNAALLRGLAKNPSERFASCGDFVVALGGERLAGARVSRSRVAQSAGGRRGGSAALRVAAALVLLMALAIGGGYAWRQQR